MRIVIPNQPAGTNLIIKARSKSGATFSDWSRNFTVTTAADTVAPKTPANPVGSMAGTSFTLKWDAVTQSADNTPASDLDRYEVKVTSSGSAQTGVYTTKDTKFEFSFEQNVNLFGTPQSNVQMAVRAVDTAGNSSGYSATQSQTNAAPAAPTGLSGTSGVNSLSFSWNAVADADLKQYRIYSGTSAGTQSTLVWTGTALNANIQITDASTDRWYKVVSVDVFGLESASSNVVGPIKPTSPVIVDITPPAVPTGLAGTLTNATDGKTASMAVSWSAVADSDLDSYVVAFRQFASPVNDWQYVTVSRDQTSTTIQGLVPYKAHDIRIRAKDWSANYSNWTTIVAVSAQANTAPATVTGLAATAGKDNLQISWTESADADVANNAGAYEVTVATNSGFTTGVLNYKTAATTLSVNGLAQNTQYYVRVRAVDSAGLTSAAWSTSANATTSNFSGGSDGAVPVGAVTLSASAGLGYIYLSWTPLTNNDPVVYDVYMSTTSGFTTYDATTKITEVSGTSAFIDTIVAGTTLVYGTTYYFKVRARDKDGVSATVSNQASAAPAQAGSTDLTTAVNTSITTAQTTADTAQLAADAADAFNKNPNFSLWSVPAAPDNWAVWTNGPTKETSLVRTPPNAVRFNCTDTTTQKGIQQSGGNIVMPTGVDYVTITVDIMLNSGTSFGGAGWLFDWTGMTGSYRNTYSFATDIPNPVTGKWYRVSKVVKRAANTGGTQTQWNFFLMGQYASIGSTQAVKDIIFNRAAVRPSTVEEISAYNAAPMTAVTDLDARTVSRGTDLVTNGTGLLSNNTNFSVFDYNGADAPSGANGSFVTKTTASSTLSIDEFIPFDPSKKYKFSFQARQTQTGITTRMYGMLIAYDAFNNSIVPMNVMYITGTTTTLAAPLNPGDTTITLTDATNWYGSAAKPANTLTYLRNMIFWDYVDPNGKAWPVGSYSRNLLNASAQPMWADGGISGNVITLTNPYAGPAKAAGTSVSNASSGGVYVYMSNTQNVLVPETWTTYTDTFTAGIMPPTSQAIAAGGAPTWAVGMPPGTAKIKVGWLLNYNTGGGKHAIAAVSLSDAQAAQATADASSKTYIQSTTPVGRSQDLWIDTTGGNNTPKRWNGSAWVAVTDKAATDAATAATNSSMTYIQSSAPTGRSQDLWIDTTAGANTPKRWNGSAWVAVTDQNAIAAAQSYTDTKFQATLKNSVVEYAMNASETVAPTTGWSTTPPTRTPGNFIWYRTVLTYGDNSTTTSSAALLTGNTGATGSTGATGPAGAPAADVALTATTQVLVSPAAGGATNPTTSTVTGTALNTTITSWTYSVDGGAFSATVPAGVSRTGNVVTITGSTMTARTITVMMADANGVSDTMTVAKTFDGATGATGATGPTGNTGSTGAAGADAYTVVLTNESQVFAGTTTNAVADATKSTTVIAYKGSVQQTASITQANITGMPTGMTAAVTNNNSNNVTVTFTVTTAMTSASGAVTIPVVVGGITFNKIFSYSIAFAGAQGATGSTGATGPAGTNGTNGVSITAVTPFFAQVTPANAAQPANPTGTTPSAPWTATEPAYVNDSAMYRSERITYSSGSPTWTTVYRSSAYDAAATAQATANGKNSIFRSTSDATGSSYTNGDLWWKLDVNGNVIKQWKFVTGTGWVVEVLNDGVLGSLDANKIVAGSTFTQTLNVKSTFTLGDATTPGVIKSYDYNLNTAGFSLSSAGLQINNGDIDAKTLRANTSFVNTLLVGTGGAVQSTNFSGTAGFQLSTNGLIIRGTGNSVDVGALNAGTITGKQFIIGTGGSFVVDTTGYFKSNTYGGTTYASGGGGTGWYLGNDGLRINEGAIDAKTLTSSTINAATITLSGASGKIVGTGFTLAGNGLTVTTGSISAPALQIQSGASNLAEPQYSAFEFTPSFYTGKFLGVNATQSIQTSGGFIGSQFLRMTTTATGQTSLIVGDTGTDYHIPVEAGKTYIISGWMKAATATAVSAYLRFKYSDGTFSTQTPVSLAGSGAWVRYSFPATVPAGVTGAVIQIFNTTTTAGVGVDVDGIMVEQQVGGLTTPSTYAMPGMTYADGGILRTGQIQSNANVSVNGTNQPAWSINMAGGAQFGDAAVRGSIIVGPSTSTNLAPNSGTFESNVTGYTAYSVGGTGVALTRTTTAGELITGTGSMKLAWTTIPTKYGFSFSLINGTVTPAGIPANNVIKVTMKVRGLTTATTAGNDVVAEFLDGSNNVVFTSANLLPTPTYLQPNTVMTINSNIVLPVGIANATTVRIVTNKTSVTPDATGIVWDDIVFSIGDDAGASYIASGNFAQGDMGWKISSGGVAEFNNVTIRGGLQTAASGPRWQIGTTPQWYGASSEIISYSGSTLEAVPAKMVSYGGGIALYGAKATDVTSYPTFSLSNQNFLTTDPNLYMGVSSLQASTVYISGNSGAASNGSRYSGVVRIDAFSDVASSVRGSSYISVVSGGSDQAAKIEQFSNGNIKLFTATTASGPTNPRLSMSYQDLDSSSFATTRITIDNTNAIVGGKYDSGTGADSSLTLGPATVGLGVYNATFGKNASISMAGSDGSLILNAGGPLNLTAANGVSALAGNVSDQMFWASRAIDMLTGGGILSIDTSYNIKWSQRFLATALGRGSTLLTDGFVAISMPTVGTVIPGYGGASNTTVVSAGIPMPSWYCLWYEPPLGGAGSTSLDANFRMTTYTGDFVVPPHWIPIAIRNNDLAMIYFGNGIGYTPWTDVPLTGWTTFDAAGTGYRQPQYRRDSFNRVTLRGVIKHATSTTTGVIGTALPAAFRPTETEMFACVANSSMARVHVDNLGQITVASYDTGGSAGWVSLSNISYFAD